jgi:CHAT domain-containing protein
LAKLEVESQPQKAISLLYQAVDIIEEMRADIKIERLRDSFIDNKLSVYEMLVLLLADQGKIEASFEAAERSRARNFIDLLGNQRLSLNRSVDQSLYDRVNTLRNRITEQRELVAQSTNPEEQAVYQEALGQFGEQLNQVMLDIQAANPQLSALVSVAPTSIERLISSLDPEMGLISYYILSKEIFCWFIDNNGVRLFRTPLERESLGRSILEYRRMIQNLEPLEAQSQTLYQWLIAPVDDQLKRINHLGIIPHGPLHYLSFATLDTGDGFLIDRVPVFYLPSAGVFDYTRAKRRNKPERLRVLAMGNPNLGDPAFNLPFAEHEVHAIKWRFPDIVILTGSKATEDWIVENIEQFEIIHLASHGEFNSINPLFSAVKLAKGGQRDGDLEAADIFGLTINADMVFLSACQTGLGKISAGDDIVGLNRAFFYAGTHTVISSLWRVSDISTAVLTKQFYRLYMTMDKAESLRGAMRHVKRMYPHPGYWGAFTLVGDAL